MGILSKLVNAVSGGAVDKTVKAGGTMLDQAFYTAQEKAKDGQLKDENDMANELERLRLVYQHEQTLNGEANLILRTLQKLPRIIGANGVVSWFVWNLWLFTMPDWAASHGFAPYTPTDYMAWLLGGIWAVVWGSRYYEKKNGVSNK